MLCKRVCILLISACLCFFYACQQKQASPLDVDLSETESPSFYDFFSGYEIIQLQLDSSAALPYLRTEWRIYNGSHYFLNKRLSILYVFDENGHLIREVNHRGHGHGEYNELYDFQINPFTGHLELLDPRMGIFEYDATGEHFFGQIPLPLLATHYFASLSEDIYVLFSESRKEDCKMLFYSKSKGKIVSEAYPMSSFLFFETPWHSGSNPFYRLGGKLYFCQIHDGTLYKINNDCHIETQYQWNFGKQNFMIEKIPADKGMQWYMDYQRREAPKYAASFSYNAENSRYFINRFSYDHKSYNLIHDKRNNQTLLMNAFDNHLLMIPEKMDEEALYYIMPGMFAERWSKDNDGLLRFPSDDPDAMYIVKYYFKKDE